ncbi:ABC transporter substrate-binding protein [Agrobacterium vaccinii]|uniref:ABC transporter substrate-binding protein n=1 Tax=Agrobacterium vaccinii TaxID=2735528 RepID=UPI001E418A86|nr:ABC transporter substrate-binding protein [Agrobacterium vaccinii]UHS58741.1 ABC transporter substrate-binding protein [Agrobacterium vaccinii]
MLTRRTLLQATAATAVASFALPAIAAGSKIKIGYVTPQSGPLSAFAQADSYMVARFIEAAKASGLDVEVVVKDSQSNPNRAAEVARELISRDEVSMMLVASTPETTNPVCSVAEAEEIPVISSVAPWQPWFIGQQGNPLDPASWKPFDFVYHFFWGLEDNVSVFLNMWNSLDTNKQVGALWPNDGDGNAWSSDVGLPPVLAKSGYKLTDPGRYQNLTDDFSAQINAFKKANCEIMTGIPIPPDFTTFWTQAAQQGFKPKAASIAKALLFPESINALGDLGHNLSAEIYWSPKFPFKSSLTGESCEELAAGFTASAKRQWTQPVGFTHALFEVAADVLKRATDPTDSAALVEAIAATKLDTVVGNIGWGKDNVPPFARKNVAKTPLVGGQWRRQGDGTFDLVIVENSNAPNIPLGGKLEALN